MGAMGASYGGVNENEVHFKVQLEGACVARTSG